MKIAFATPNFPPEFLGGTERVVLALARALRADGDEVLVLSGSDRPHAGDDVVREEFDGLTVCRVPRLPGEEYSLDISRPRLLDVCREVLRDSGCEVLHAHHWALLSTGLVRAAEQLGLATVVSLHDLWSTCPRFFRRPPDGITCPSGGDRAACVPCAQQALPHLSSETIRDQLASRDAELHAELRAGRRLTVPSRACAERLREHLPWGDEFEVVPHGLLEAVGDTPREAPTPGVLRIGTFGNLVEEKGVMLLVWACRDLPGVELHLHGPFLDASFAAAVRAKAAEFGVTLVCHGGYGQDAGHPARRLDLAVFPSLCEETYGLVVEEALARGTPVVVSDRGALAERIGDGGVAVSVDELGPLANTLRELVTEPARLAALRAGLPTRFASILDAAARYRELYVAVLENSP